MSLLHSGTAAAVLLALLVAGCETPPPDPVREASALSELAQRRGEALQRAGITKIVAWSQRADQPVQVLTRSGPVYFPLPRELQLLRFALVVDGARVQVRSDEYDAGAHELQAEAMRKIVDEAIRLAGRHTAQADERARNAR